MENEIFRLFIGWKTVFNTNERHDALVPFNALMHLGERMEDCHDDGRWQ